MKTGYLSLKKCIMKLPSEWQRVIEQNVAYSGQNGTRFLIVTMFLVLCSRNNLFNKSIASYAVRLSCINHIYITLAYACNAGHSHGTTDSVCSWLFCCAAYFMRWIYLWKHFQCKVQQTNIGVLTYLFFFNDSGFTLVGWY